MPSPNPSVAGDPVRPNPDDPDFPQYVVSHPTFDWVYDLGASCDAEWKTEVKDREIPPIFMEHMQRKELHQLFINTIHGPHAWWNRKSAVITSNIREVQTDGEVYAIKFVLPVFAPWSVECEVATMRFCRLEAKLPVPRVHAFQPYPEGVDHAPSDDEHKQQDNTDAPLLPDGIPSDSRVPSDGDGDSDSDSVSSASSTYSYLKYGPRRPMPFPWIISDIAPWSTMRMSWYYLTTQQRMWVTRDLAAYHARLLNTRFQGIGSIYEDISTAHTRTPTAMALLGSLALLLFVHHPIIASILAAITICALVNPPSTHRFRLGPIVPDFFQSETKGKPRGPYRNCHEWYTARLTYVSQKWEKKRAACREPDCDTCLTAADVSSAADLLLRQALPILFHPEAVETTSLSLNELELDDIFIDPYGKIQGLTGWSRHQTLPPWLAFEIPHVMQGETASAPQGEPHEDYFTSDNSVLTNNWILWYELGFIYSRVYFEEMERLVPAWTPVRVAFALEKEFESIVWNVEMGWPRVDAVEEFIERLKVERGNVSEDV